MEIKKLDYDFSVCKVVDYSRVNSESDFCFMGKADEGNSLACLTEAMSDNIVKRDDGWKAFQIRGALDLSSIGILPKIPVPLAEDKIGIFTVSTYNTDYVLAKQENFEKVIQMLENAGHTIV